MKTQNNLPQISWITTNNDFIAFKQKGKSVILRNLFGIQHFTSLGFHCLAFGLGRYKLLITWASKNVYVHMFGYKVSYLNNGILLFEQEKTSVVLYNPFTHTYGSYFITNSSLHDFYEKLRNPKVQVSGYITGNLFTYTQSFEKPSKF